MQQLIESFKIPHNFTNINLGAAFTFNTGQPIRGHPFKLTKSRYNLKLRKNFSQIEWLFSGIPYPVML